MKRATVSVDLVLNQEAVVKKTIPHLLELIVQNMEISCPVPPRLKVLSMMITLMATKQNSNDRFMAKIMEEKTIPIIRYEEFATDGNVS